MDNLLGRVVKGTSVARDQRINCKFRILPALMRGRHAFRCLSACACRLANVSRLCFPILLVGMCSPALVADQPGGRFDFSYPNFTGAAGAMTAQPFLTAFDAAIRAKM